MSKRVIVAENFVYTGLNSVPGNVYGALPPDIISAMGSGAAFLPLYTATGDETTYQNDYLINGSLLWVTKNGNPLEIVASIDPSDLSGNQVTLNNVTGTVTFQTALSQYDVIGILYKA